MIQMVVNVDLLGLNDLRVLTEDGLQEIREKPPVTGDLAIDQVRKQLPYLRNVRTQNFIAKIYLHI